MDERDQTSPDFEGSAPGRAIHRPFGLLAVVCSLAGAIAAVLGCHASATPLAGSSDLLASAVAPSAPLGLGRAATAEEIAAWDIDIRADGQGLPPGSGDARTGRMLYQEQCQRCHGTEGRDGTFDRLAGREPGDGFDFALDPRLPRTIGSYWPHATTIFDYTRRSMPLDRPGSLDDDAVYALTAYLLHLNGLWDLDTPLDRTTLPRVVMPAQDRFVPDDRRGGPEIR